jgi:hypothetical protein
MELVAFILRAAGYRGVQRTFFAKHAALIVFQTWAMNILHVIDGQASWKDSR